MKVRKMSVFINMHDSKDAQDFWSLTCQKDLSSILWYILLGKQIHEFPSWLALQLNNSAVTNLLGVGDLLNGIKFSKLTTCYKLPPCYKVSVLGGFFWVVLRAHAISTPCALDLRSVRARSPLRARSISAPCALDLRSVRARSPLRARSISAPCALDLRSVRARSPLRARSISAPCALDLRSVRSRSPLRACSISAPCALDLRSIMA